MTKLLYSIALSTLVFSAGCSKDEKSDGKSGGKPGGNTCASMGPVAAGRQVAAISRQADAKVAEAAKKMQPEMAKILTTRCTEDKWPQAAIDCGATAQDPGEDCEKEISKELNQKLGEDLRAAMMKAMGK
jgi:hypothetical protein